MSNLEQMRRNYIIVLSAPIVISAIYSIYRMVLDFMYIDGNCVTIDIICNMSDKYSEIIPKIRNFSNDMIVNNDTKNMKFMENTFFFNIIITYSSLLLFILLLILKKWPNMFFLEYIYNNMKNNYSKKYPLMLILFTSIFVCGTYFLIFESDLYRYKKFGSIIYASKLYVFREILVAWAVYFLSLGGAAIFAAKYRCELR